MGSCCFSFSFLSLIMSVLTLFLVVFLSPSPDHYFRDEASVAEEVPVLCNKSVEPLVQLLRAVLPVFCLLSRLQPQGEISRSFVLFCLSFWITYTVACPPQSLNSSSSVFSFFLFFFFLIICTQNLMQESILKQYHKYIITNCNRGVREKLKVI